MVSFTNRIRALIEGGAVRISEHGYDELAEDGLTAKEVLEGMTGALLVEDYPDNPKGPCALFLQFDESGDPLHAVWGIPKGCESLAVLVTAYRPDPNRWDESFTRRKPR